MRSSSFQKSQNQYKNNNSQQNSQSKISIQSYRTQQPPQKQHTINSQYYSSSQWQNIHYQLSEGSVVQSKVSSSKISHSIRSQIKKKVCRENKVNQKRRKFMGLFDSSLTNRLKYLYEISFICEICQIQRKNYERAHLTDCEHKFCHNCLKQYAIFKTDRFEPIQCPAEGCQSLMKLSGIFFNSLPQQKRKMAKKIDSFNRIKSHDNLKLCPHEQCQNGILNLNNAEQQRISCEKCQMVFCKKCLFPFHIGKCQTNQLVYFQRNYRYRQCPKCKIVIQRLQGCRKMKCRCGYQFCHVCGIKWPGYGHQHSADQEYGDVPYQPYQPPPFFTNLVTNVIVEPAQRIIKFVVGLFLCSFAIIAGIIILAIIYSVISVPLEILNCFLTPHCVFTSLL